MTDKKELSGWLVLDKPEGISSAHLVGKVKHALRRATGQKPKIGHTGTLDPFASGVLPLALGEATKLCQFLIDDYKGYQFDIAWGHFTNTGDNTGEVTLSSDNIPDIDAIKNILPEFTGDIMQVPHKFSAIKVDGKRAYDLARNGEEFELKARPLHIETLEIISHRDNVTRLYVECSKGTYVRVLAEDIARRLNSSAHVSYLRRTAVGLFDLSQAIGLDNEDEIFYKAVLAPEIALDGIPALNISEAEQGKIRHGQSLFRAGYTPESERFLLKHSQKIIAIAGFENGMIRPKRILNY